MSEAGRGTSRSLLGGMLARDGKGEIYPTLSNALLILAMDPVLEGMLAYDEFKAEHLLKFAPPPARETDSYSPGPYPRGWGKGDVVLVQAYLQRQWSHKFSAQTVEDAMITEAERCRFHPVCDWLDTLSWDGQPRLDEWLLKAFGCPADPYHKAAGAKMLIASVRRVRRPGCKFDNMPVFEGLQGIGKSTALRSLYGDDWFSDNMPTNLASKDAAMALLGIWCLELAELQQLIRAEAEVVKGFLSRQVDRYRPPYGKSYIARARQGILVGTTNAEEWLSDPTGNRRFWPLACAHVDAEWIAENREQLWAEAAAREAAGEVHWLDGDEAREGAVAQQASRMVLDPWSDKARNWLDDGRVQVTAAGLLDHLNVPAAQQTKGMQMRAAAILKSEGWVRDRSATNRFWVRKEGGQNNAA
ncbi:virulence-associated E family protein [Roseomonas gilardii]|uniref:Virulence-associated E family protein n=1 Tax=Roseomonas gilardii TaxID=257708 RepID=A0ABU3MJ75_9PROT|nr:virulence-associated E family protein [Roseomonas gilardii]MDT8333013.1 virulence-associated E family protein [Roseomonas gilardii]